MNLHKLRLWFFFQKKKPFPWEILMSETTTLFYKQKRYIYWFCKALTYSFSQIPRTFSLRKNLLLNNSAVFSHKNEGITKHPEEAELPKSIKF